MTCRCSSPANHHNDQAHHLIRAFAVILHHSSLRRQMRTFPSHPCP